MKSKLTTLRKKADKAIQEHFTEGVCEACGINPADCVHHWIPKSQSNNLRDDPKNLIPICRGCHFKHHTCGDPNIARRIEQKRGKEWADDLQARRYTIFKPTREYLQGIIEQYEN